MRALHVTACIAVLVAAAGACGGELAEAEGAGSTSRSPLVEGTVFWGPSDTDVVDRAFVRLVDANRSVRCVATRCDGTFSVREGDFRSLRFPVFVSVERARDPEASAPEGLVLRRLPESIDEGATLRVHLFFDQANADAARLAPTGSCAPGAAPELVECPEDRR